MSSSNDAMLARVKLLALRAMIDAGGSVVVSADRLAPPPPCPHVAPAYRPRRRNQQPPPPESTACGSPAAPPRPGGSAATVGESVAVRPRPLGRLADLERAWLRELGRVPGRRAPGGPTWIPIAGEVRDALEGSTII